MNLLSPLPEADTAERVDALLTRPGLRIERIVSRGQASPPGFWYDQAEGEWVMVLAGAARLRFADETEARHLRPGDWLDIAPHRRHRVEWTLPSRPCGSRYSTGRSAPLLIRENRVKNRFRPEKPPRPPPKIHLNQSLVGGPLPARAGSLFAACRVAKTAIRVETGGQAAASELLIRHEEYTAIVAPRWQSSIVGGR